MKLTKKDLACYLAMCLDLMTRDYQCYGRTEKSAIAQVCEDLNLPVSEYRRIINGYYEEQCER